MHHIAHYCVKYSIISTDEKKNEMKIFHRTYQKICIKKYLNEKRIKSFIGKIKMGKNIISNNNNKKLIDHSSTRWIKEFILLFSLIDSAVVQEWQLRVLGAYFITNGLIFFSYWNGNWHYFRFQYFSIMQILSDFYVMINKFFPSISYDFVIWLIRSKNWIIQKKFDKGLE